MHPLRTKLAAVSAAAALAVVGGVALAPPAAGEPASATPAAELDYFAEAFPGLREHSVFTPVTYERFERLLDTEGTYAFLIGGPADPTTRAAVEHIDAVAQEYGVDTVYTFDPRLDGDEVDLRTFGSEALSEQLTRLYTGYTNPANNTFDPGYTNYLNTDTTPQFGVPEEDPYLFVYDKNHKVGDAEDRVLASLGGTVTEQQVATEEGRKAYREQVGEVFSALGDGGADTQSQFEFFSTAVNERHAQQYADAARYGGDIFGDADENGFRLQSITYPELELLLESEGTHTILFGGTWCHNTRAVISEVNRAAAASGNDTVYVFDLRLDGSNGDQRHIRDSVSEISYLYGDLVAQHFPNLRTQFLTTGEKANPVAYHPGGDLGAELRLAQKLQVPYLIDYDKDRVVDGQPAPIAKDWIHDDGDGTFTEYMTEWWWVNDLPGAPLREGQDTQKYRENQVAQWAFADEALAKIDGFFGLATTPDAPAAPTATVSGSAVTVSWTAPQDNGAEIVGYQVSLDGAPAVTVAAPATSHTFAEVATGSHTATVAAVNHIGASAASPASNAVRVVASPNPSPSSTLPSTGAEPSLSVRGALQPGGRIVVDGADLTPDAAVRVELHSTPVVLGETTTSAAGAFSLTTTIPQSTTPGVHAVVVYVDGVRVVSTPVTVAAAALAVTGGSDAAWGLGVAGLAVVLAGAAAVVFARRRAA